jgi:hypothetical protein
VQPQEKYLEMLLRTNIYLSQFFEKRLSNHKGRLDPIKLQEVIKEEFKDLSDRLFDILKKVFNNFKIPIDFDLYCGTIQKFAAISPDTCKDIMFYLLDLNKDKKICETDLFN